MNRKAAGTIVYRLNSYFEVLVGEALHGRGAGKQTLCFVTTVRPGEDSKAAAARALLKETGTQMAVGPLKWLGKFGPTVFISNLEHDGRGRITGFTQTNTRVYDLGITTEIFAAEWRRGTPQDSADVRHLRFLNVGEIARHCDRLMHDQKEMLFRLNSFLRRHY